MQTENQVNILIVDNCPENLLAIEQVLEELGQNLVTANSGESALKYLLNRDFAVIILDVQMPKIDGFETAKRIRANPNYRNTPIIFLTGFHGSEQILKGYAAGGIDYIVKPIEPEILIAKVSVFIDLFKKTAQLEKEIRERQQAELALKQANEELEIRVEERTAELLKSNEILQVEIEERQRTQAELQKYAAQLQDLYNNAPCGYHSLDSEGTFIRINDTELKMLGYAREEIVGKKKFSDLLTPESLNVFKENFPRFKQRGWVRNLEFQMIRKDGSILPVSLNAIAIKDESGNYIMSRSTAIDISERKRAEAALENSEIQYRLLFENNPNPMWVFDPQTLGFLAVNQAAVATYGYSVSEFLAMTIADIRPVEDVELLKQTMKKLGAVYNSGDWRHRKRDGTIIDVEINCHTIIWEGKPAKFVFAKDISDRKRIEEKLKLTQQRLRFLLTSSPAVIYSCQAFGDYAATFVSENVSTMLGYESREFIENTKFWAEHIHPEDAPQVFANLADVFTQGHHIHEYRFLHKDGSYRWFRDELVLVRDASDQPLEIVGYWIDISEQQAALGERKQAERALQKQAEQRRLVMEMAQRIRCSLNLEEILQTTVEEVRQFLGTDRAIIFRFESDWSGMVAVESVAQNWTSILSTTIRDPCFGDNYIVPFQQGLVTAKSDIYNAGIGQCHIELLANFQVRANLVVPILQGENLWGLLIAHHCQAPREWQPLEIDLLRQLAIQVGIAIQQSTLFEQVQNELSERQRAETALKQARDRLEIRVQERTKELSQTNATLQTEITERIETERKLEQIATDLKRSNQELEQFAYVASHDLQEPLRAVEGYTKLLFEEYKHHFDQTAQEYASFIVDGSARMRQLIQDMLTYSRVGTRGEKFVSTNCNEVLGLALRDLQIAITENNATITHDDLPTVTADPSQLVLLFQNLIGNGIKFHRQEPPKIHIGAVKGGALLVENSNTDRPILDFRLPILDDLEAQPPSFNYGINPKSKIQNLKSVDLPPLRQSPSENEYLFWVRDNGIGIKPRYLDRIFEIFKRLHTRKEFPGTGIGLAICKKIVERHGGRIWADSQPGVGTTFFFTLPVTPRSKEL